ncbi:MAG TPA: deoxynucleoside kinase [Pyrinomonadaceae bacterium]|nr:deoxynucleoside kinase [Pyrinomonadaceae bacterium]
MNRGIIELGHLIRSFREAKHLTQRELARELSSTRTAIALMEQGRRLLDAEDLRSVSSFLNIPGSLIAPFMSPALQSRRNKVAPQPASFVPFRILCLSGISGSGKTELGNVIARTFSVDRIGSHPTGKAYLQDLAIDQDRWAFEAQVAFLVTKTSQIWKKLDYEQPLVVERWIEEDILIYERLFEEIGAITTRSHETFQQVSTLARYLLPQPEYYFYCECDVETAFRRVHTRARSDSKLHTREYIARSKDLYKQWLESLEGPEVYILNTDRSDLSRPGLIEEVFREIQSVLTQDFRNPQIDLFDDGPTSTNRLHHLQPFRTHRWSPLIKSRRKIAATSPLVAPVAYLAAPFSGRDILPEDTNAQSSLFEITLGHGVIPRSGFRQELLGVERALGSYGLTVLLPHRDVNEWGRKQLKPEEAMRDCTDHVENCDLFVGLLGSSCGAHYEFGIAFAAGKPCILVETEDLSNSFLASGASVLESDDLIYLKCRHLRDAEDLIRTSPAVRSFMERHLGRGMML